MKKVAVGIDIGGTNTVFGVVDSEGNIYAESSFPTTDYPSYDDYKPFITKMAESINELLDALVFDYELVGIGVGAPNASYHTGAIERPANLWKYREGFIAADEARIFPIAEDLMTIFPQCGAVLATNDANAATIGEMMFGAARGMKDFVMVTLGTGLGSGFVAGGEMIYGHNGMAGELGHIAVVRGNKGRECGCGKCGCLETYVSATGITRTAIELLSEYRTPSELRNIPYNELESLTIAQAAQAGDAIALEAFRRTGEVLGQALADVVAITTPEAIILFGGLAKSGDLIFEPTIKYMEENLMPTMRGTTKVLPSGVQNCNIAILGAAALVWQRQGVE